MKKEEKMIVSSQDTDIMALAGLLNDEQVKDLLSCLKMLERIKNYEI